ncbi:hypothetical protein C2R22_17230 [Salinigranum rubrum]|uniref:Uncharacterized protein n=1 Tax=Salinigranum rubrum TaxID=755307 RepID=A0A2I8VMR8_9EURY|nr:hypothetical protein [Salinigranum rubrum]AUV83174.1 hypothetical protein C2R22_17230 [Salinigranum rubrum]
MRRRPALAVLATLVGAVSGCGTRLPPSARTPASVASTGTPTLDESPPLDELPCPPADVNPETAVCPGERDDASVAVRTNRPSVALDDAGSVRFVLENGTGDGLRFNPNNPDVYRFTGERYELVERRSSGSGVTTVPPNGTYSWRLADLPQFDRLSVGTFLFAVSVPTAGTMGADWVTCLAPFRLTDGRG